MSGLSLKAQQAVEYYLVGGNKSAAYAQAYGRGKASRNAFDVKVNKFFNGDKVKAEIRRRQQAIAEKTDITKERIMRRLEMYAFTDMPGIVHFDNTRGMSLEDFDNLTPAQRACIKKFEFKRDPPEHNIKTKRDKDGTLLEPDIEVVQGAEQVKVELHDPIKPLVQLGIEIGMFEKKNTQPIVDRPVIVLQGMPAPPSPQGK